MRRLPALALLALASCDVPESEPPSLGPRPIEAMADEPPQAVPPIPSREDPALASRIDELVAQAERGETAFREALPGTEAAVARARGAAAESEAWIAAQLALSALGGARGPAATALGELDAILAAQVQSGEPAEVERLAAARARVEAINAAQARDYQALADQLNPL